MRTYRVAILGCRARGTDAARAYAAHPRTEVVALCDLLPERAAQLGDELGVSARYTDLDRMIAEAQPDLVVIPTGTEFHFPLAMRVLEYGVHLDVEKPLCQDLEQADALLTRAAEKGARVAVHHQSGVGASLRAVEAALRAGKIGEVRHLQGSCKGYYGGYGVMNIGTHMVHNMVALAGRCRSVTALALTGGRPITPEDVVQAPGGMGIVAGEKITGVLEHEGGVTSTVYFHRFPRAVGAAYHFEILGTEGRILWKEGGAWRQPLFYPDPAQYSGEWQPLPPPGLIGEPGVPERGLPEGGPQRVRLHPAPPAADLPFVVAPDEYAYVDEYVHALDEDRDPPCSGEAARHALEILVGLFEAAAYGVRVTLPQARRDHPLLRWRRGAGLPDPEPRPREYRDWLAAEDERISRG